MEWQIVLAIILVLPVILLPLALIWYMNISGLYQVMRDAREKRKRRARAVREAGRLI